MATRALRAAPAQATRPPEPEREKSRDQVNGAVRPVPPHKNRVEVSLGLHAPPLGYQVRD